MTKHDPTIPNFRFSERDIKILKALENKEFWRVDYSKLAKGLNIPVSSVFGSFERLKKARRYDLELKVKIYSDLELLEKRKNIKE